jgi:hypothetical protein
VTLPTKEWYHQTLRDYASGSRPLLQIADHDFGVAVMRKLSAMLMYADAQLHLPTLLMSGHDLPLLTSGMKSSESNEEGFVGRWEEFKVHSDAFARERFMTPGLVVMLGYGHPSREHKVQIVRVTYPKDRITSVPSEQAWSLLT